MPWLMLCLWLLVGTLAQAGTVTTRWEAPTTNVDGSPLTDLAGYRLSIGTEQGQYTRSITLGLMANHTLTLPGGQAYYFVVTAFDTQGNESGHSTEVQLTLPPDVAVTPPTPTPTPLGLVAGYNFNEPSGLTVQDSTGVHPGTIQGASRTSSGKYGRALTFDGVNDLVMIPPHPAFDLTTGMTLMAWVYPTVSLTGWRTILQKEPAAYYLHANSDINRPATGIWIDSERSLKAGNRLPKSVWTHLAATYNGTHQRLYVNGMQVGSRTQTGTIHRSDSPIQIGGNAAFREWFKGRLDDVRIYNTALTPAAINTARQTPLP